MCLRFAALAAIVVVAGCTQSRVPLGSDDGGVDAGGGVRCGSATCAAGQECCNESCGLCTEPGEGCPAIACVFTCGGEACPAGVYECCPGCDGEEVCAGPGGECPPVACPTPSCRDGAFCPVGEICCEGCFGASFCAEESTGCPAIDCPADCGADSDCGPGGACCPDCSGGRFCAAEGLCPACPEPEPCTPMDARGEGLCDAFFGWAWTGEACTSVSGCSCVGAECDRLFDSLEACERRYASCGGCTSDVTCGVSGWCNPCARGSCPECDDCVQDCAPSRCATGEMPTCRAIRPECGETGVAIVVDGCWLCVDAYTCERLPAGDCRATGCAEGSSCQLCRTGYACVPDGAVC